MRTLKVENILLVFICTFAGVMMLFPSAVKPMSIAILISDTYYVLGGLYCSLLLLTYCFLLFALYKILRRKRRDVNVTFALLHILVTISFIALFLRSEFFVTTTFSFKGIGRYRYSPAFRFFTTILFIVAQAGFFFYFFVEWLRTRKKV